MLGLLERSQCLYVVRVRGDHGAKVRQQLSCVLLKAQWQIAPFVDDQVEHRGYNIIHRHAGESTPVNGDREAKELTEMMEAIARRVARTEASRYARRTVVSVQDPATAGRGGTCTVIDGLGQLSFGIRWYEHRPLVDDVVVMEVPPPGGTRRIVAIDREMS